MDIPRNITIRHHSHRILNPLTDEKLAALGRALALRDGWTMLDLACGKGEMLCAWARDHGLSGTGVDLSSEFIAAARARAAGLGLSAKLEFVQAEARGHVARVRTDLAACIGASWIAGGVAGTIALLERSLKPSGLLLIGEPYWRVDPPDEETARGCYAASRDQFRRLTELTDSFRELGWDLVEMMLADQDSWDRYVAPQWLNIRRWLDANPHDPLHEAMRQELDDARWRHLRYQRDYLGWGVFALLKRDSA